ncbi:MAG: glutamine amidotransferase-related protein [Ewingella sp.]|uniref:glutamine amidotransferase-related protein n=1 Tax=Ewingella TaxID=41201 RepID=UPI00336544FF
MTITFIAHSTPEPALYGAMAAILAELRALPLCHLPVTHDAKRFTNARQHVTAQGQQVTSGLVWLERLTGRSPGAEMDFDSLITRALREDIVIPSIQPLDRELALRAAENGIEVESLQVVKQQEKFHLEDVDTGKMRSNGWARDIFGRWAFGSVLQPVMRAGQKLRVAIVGEMSEHRESYPALLAALGDAADALALNIEVVGVAPTLSGSQLDSTLFDIDGVLLPGLLPAQGENPQNGLLAIATWALDNRLPALGINQGMHHMVAALGQKTLGRERVVMHGPATLNALQTCLPVPQNSARSMGNQQIYSQPGSRMAQILGRESTQRYNQRWSLNPELVDELQGAGLDVSATGEKGRGIAAVELRDHPFFVGIQSHPELQSRRERASSLLMAFLQEIRNNNRQRDISHATLSKSVRLKQSYFSMG